MNIINQLEGRLFPEWHLLLKGHFNFRSLGVECYQPSLDISCKLSISFSCNTSPSSIQVSGRTCHRLIQTSSSICTLLNGGCLASYSYQYGGRYLSLVSHCKRFLQGCVCRLVAQGLAITAFNIWLLWDMCCVDKASLVSASHGGNSDLQHVCQWCCKD